MTRYEPHCDCLGGHVSMLPDPNGRWCRAEEGWQDISKKKPPMDEPFLARNPGSAAFIAEWSQVDQEFLHFDPVEGWCPQPFTHWRPIPPLDIPTEADHA
ncbi:hypothetical protein A6J80_03070 [Paracoccus yeei]|uniref:DUF551 domain-containing protein n=1 Tax=Paracoccus yeei TaxID=147645 RepID=A0A1V0GNT5_9RHOB|nr:hypothetical protein [Paracoccus yeei]ARC35495.1 hypothetical protein A6J80_03070 [Paracoccus yeei]